MKKLFYIILLLLIATNAKAQHLFSEHYIDKVNMFCLDCGDPYAMPPSDYIERLVMNFDKKSLLRIKGDIFVQILVDSVGNARLLSAENHTNVKSKKLGLQKAINAITWNPAVGDNSVQSVQQLIRFQDGMIYVTRMSFKPHDTEPEDKNIKQDKSLTHSFKVYNSFNSKLPWNMSRAVAVGSSGTIWMGTDQGLACMKNEEMYVLNQNNSPLATYKDTNDLQAIMDLAFDVKGRLWISQGRHVFLYDDEPQPSSSSDAGHWKDWTHFDKTNSPIDWCTGFSLDKCENVWVRTFHGAYQYVDSDWMVIDSTKYPLPSNNISSIYVDSRHRTWIGTYKGSILVENNTIETFDSTSCSIKDIAITDILEDNNKNIWLIAYNNYSIFRYDSDGLWHKYECPFTKNWGNTSFSSMAINEEKNELWISVYHVGLLLLHIDSNKWELYTPNNSNLPADYIEHITIDNFGHLWGATFGGIISDEK